MSNLSLTPQWHNAINQVETTEKILGGASGNANLASKQLAENIFWLKQAIENISNESIKVGDIYTTTISHTNAAAVATHHGYGTWVRYAEGRTLVGLSTKAADPDDYKTMGNDFGANMHKLTIAESPSHKHSHSDKYQYYIARHHRGESVSSGDSADLQKEWQLHGQTEAEFASALEEPRGGDEPHNNIQPSKVVAHWLRTA